MNKRYINLLDEIWENFKRLYKSSRNIYEDEDKANRLIHPEEYGKYREDACKYFLSNVLPKKYGISDGFIITSDNKVSTQCDIIIYDEMNTPILKNEVGIKFFPIESVVGIGEVKSIINMDDLTKAAIKLANNKMLKEQGDSIDKVDVFTFIICERINNIKNNNFKITNMYDGIGRLYWHNVILSLDDGLFTYSIDKKDYKNKKKNIKQEIRTEIERSMNNFFYNSIVYGINCEHFFNNDSKERYYNFISIINNFLKGLEIDYPDPTIYLFG